MTAAVKPTKKTAFQGRTLPAWNHSRRRNRMVTGFSRSSCTSRPCIKDYVLLDPCCGSGHILAYLFDVLMQIYEAYGYTTREAVASIVENNIYGLDIDDRAAQLANFAVMMKARQYDRRFFSHVVQPKVYAIVESNHIDNITIEYVANGDEKLENAINTIVKEMHDAKEYGSILSTTSQDWSAIFKRFEDIKQDISMHRDLALNDLMPVVEVAHLLAQKYYITVTNPPYMGSNGMSPALIEYVKKKYPDSKSDLFAIFIEHCSMMNKVNGYQAMITQHAWMFLSSFEKLRNKLFLQDIVNMAHLGARAFEEIGGEVVQTTSFVLRKTHIVGFKGVYCRLIGSNSQFGKEEMFLAKKNRFEAKQDNFNVIPGSPIAYWVTKPYLEVFKSKTMSDFGSSCIGMRTGDNERFLRFWSEVGQEKFGIGYKSAKEAQSSGKKWFPYCKGGSFRKWYGNNDYVVNWENDGFEIKENTKRVYPYLGDKLGWKISNEQYYFQKGLTWSGVGARVFGVRSYPDGMIFDSGANSFFVNNSDDYYYFAGLLNCVIMNDIINIINPTINTGCGVIAQLPAIKSSTYKGYIETLVKECIGISKDDWNSFETSWDYSVHPLVAKNRLLFDDISNVNLAECFMAWENECNDRFNKLKTNEEELNRIFIHIYGLQDELTPEVEDKDVTVRKADLQRDIKSLISYAVGCMFGRYSLEKPGLVYAGGDFESVYDKFVPTNENLSNYTHAELSNFSVGELQKPFFYLRETQKKPLFSFHVDADNIIPICSDEYFTDDIVGRFVKFIETVYGKKALDSNLKFIADALGGKGQPMDVIRNYFINDFYADHCKIYQKRPIYWLFDSGRKGGFKALIYMHRYQQDTIARMRTDYVHEQQGRYRTEISDLETRIAGASTSERVKLNKQLLALQGKAAEIRQYEEKIHHLADQMIRIDLDDGVKNNYAIFQDVLAKIK